eukprot:2487342-Pleurochrysis_carterae.AAC.2
MFCLPSLAHTRSRLRRSLRPRPSPPAHHRGRRSALRSRSAHWIQLVTTSCSFQGLSFKGIHCPAYTSSRMQSTTKDPPSVPSQQLSWTAYKSAYVRGPTTSSHGFLRATPRLPLSSSMGMF